MIVTCSSWSVFSATNDLLSSNVLWDQVYDLPLKLRSDSMAKKLGDIIGKHEETNMKEVYVLGKFLRIKVTIDLHSVKRWSISRSASRVFSSGIYERLPTFYLIILLVTQSCGITSDSSVLPITQSPKVLTESMTKLDLLTRCLALGDLN